ncbi:MAG TPA: DUF5808 domain-containing protein [Ktedonobacteraceae bacterium]|nr:DUF5808 domain-containing protein [Ktedonobacteraceae bacterium]
MSKGDKQEKKLLTPGNIVFSIATATLLSIAIGEQLRRPPEERTWQGKVFGIPYDFRRPTMERLRATFWNADSASLFVPKAFGMGWDINFYPLFHPQASDQQA